MNVQVTCRHAEISEALRAYASERLGAVERHGLEFPSAEIVMDQGREGLTCEILLHPRRGDPLLARETSHDARAAVDAAVGKIQSQVSRAKERRDDNRRAAS